MIFFAKGNFVDKESTNSTGDNSIGGNDVPEVLKQGLGLYKFTEIKILPLDSIVSQIDRVQMSS